MFRRSISAGAAAAIAFALGGCSITFGVQGASDDGRETLTGTATAYSDGSGVLKIVTSEGRSCSGEFVFIHERQAQGTFTCSDGQRGPFSLVGTRGHGTGSGTIGGKPFSFTFG